MKKFIIPLCIAVLLLIAGIVYLALNLNKELEWLEYDEDDNSGGYYYCPKCYANYLDNQSRVIASFLSSSTLFLYIK